MEYLIAYAFGFASALFIAVVVLVLYERQNKIARHLLDITRQDLSKAIDKVMAVDYERLQEAEAVAKAEAMAAYNATLSQVREVAYTDDMGPMIQEPTMIKVPGYGGGSEGE